MTMKKAQQVAAEEEEEPKEEEEDKKKSWMTMILNMLANAGVHPQKKMKKVDLVSRPLHSLSLHLLLMLLLLVLMVLLPLLRRRYQGLSPC